MSRIITRPNNKANHVISAAGDAKIGDVLTVEINDKQHFLQLIQSLKAHYPAVIFTGETFKSGDRYWSYIHIKSEHKYQDRHESKI